LLPSLDIGIVALYVLFTSLADIVDHVSENNTWRCIA